MMEDTAVGATSSNVSHCASKSGGTVSPADAGTVGPHDSRNFLIRSSVAGSRIGLGSGIHRFIWKGPLLLDRNSCTYERIPAGGVSRAPVAPIPPVFATAMERLAGEAPAMGATSMGTLRPYVSQNELARSSGSDLLIVMLSI